MKNKIYKLISILLTVAIVFSTCVCAFGTVFATEENSNKTVVYYVSSDGNDEIKDPENASFKTINGAVIYAKYTAALDSVGNTVIVKVKNENDTVNWAEGEIVDAHNFKLIVTSANTLFNGI